MRMPRKGVLIRLAIYVPLLGYFGWRAFAHWQAENQAAVEVPAVGEPAVQDPFEGMPTRTIDVDGKQLKVYEITPEQAEVYLGAPTSKPDAPGADAALPAPAQGASEAGGG